MNNITMINNAPLVIKELNGQRVVTFKDIDELHGRPDGTAKDRFNANKKRFIPGLDYYLVKPSQKHEFHTFGVDIPNRGITLITETGYPMLVKSFNDDLAWAVQRALVNSYFKGKINPPPTDFLYDDTVITLISSRACELYMKTKPAPAHIVTLRQSLTCAGLLMPYEKADRKRRIKGAPYCSMRFQRQTVNAISGYNVPLLTG